MVEYTKNMLYARKVLAVLFMHLITGDSTWLIVNAGSILSCSLARSMGFKSMQDCNAFLFSAGLAAYVNRGPQGWKFEIKTKEFEMFFKQHGFDRNVMEIDIWRGDIDSKLKDKRQNKVNSIDYHVIRLGNVVE